MAVKLTVSNVKTLPDGKHADSVQPGLFLYVRNKGTNRSYQHYYRRHGKDVWGKVGSIRKIGLAEAREEVIRQKAALLAGKDPKHAKPAPATARTFKDDVLAYYEWSKGGGADETHEAWSDSTAVAFINSFTNHLFANLGDRETTSLTTGDYAAAIEPVWKASNNTAQRLCQRVHAVLEHAIETDDHGRFPTKHNVADGLLRRLPKGYRKKRVPMRAAKWHTMPALYALWVQHDTMAAYALRFLALTCAPRAAEVFELRWREIDANFGHPIWTVPESRMKGRVTRQIPLSAEAVAVLDAVRQGSNCDPDAFVFAGRGEGGRIGVHAMLNLLRSLDLDLHVHGFRACFKSFGLDNTKHPLDRDAIELCLDHVIGSAVAEAYRDTGLLAHRRILADRWAAWLTGKDYTGSYGAALPTFAAAA